MQKFGLQLVSSPESEPGSLEEAKTHLRVDFPDDDGYILALISAAREVVEGKLRRAVFQQTYALTLDQFPYPTGTLTRSPEQRENYLFPSVYFADYAIELPRSKVTAVDSITFQDVTGDTVTLPEDQYVADLHSEPTRIVPANGGTWPYINSYSPGSITITFKAGLWDGDSVPASVKHAMLLLIGHWYANREAVTENKLTTLPLAVDALLERWKYYGP
jgi:hypothetical protein